ncbi:MAG: 2-oxoacid:acceptor oxidoreductase family protein, partial [Alphaproteobacteria bacterium]|nr:2-oxoacid:acceptor oxidoreductase family protein [Alphaproteobacteria bacterium]
YLIVQDGTLLHDPGISAGLKPTGAMIVNATLESSAVSDRFGCRAVCLPATELAMKEIGRPIPNTVLLAALLSLTELFPLDALQKALRGRFTGDILDKNLRLIEIAAGLVEKSAWKVTADA